MTPRRTAPSIAANPILVGAATVLVIVVGVFLAYNANSGLPFVPTYQINAEVPDAAELVPGFDVRIGGKRVGVVSDITAVKRPGGSVYAKLALKLDKAAEPLAADTRVLVRPRSAIGLKYVELTPGDSRETVAPGGTLPLSQSQSVVELDDALNTFDTQVRKATGEVVTTLSDGVAGRGADLNAAIEEIDPLLTHLQPVMRALRSRSANLKGFIDQLDSAALTLQPVAGNANGLIDGLTTTLDAVGAQTPALRDTLDLLPGTEATGTRALRVARPVLDDAAQLAVALRPGADLLERGTRRLADVVETGTPVLKRATTLGPDLERTLAAGETLARDPNTIASVTTLTGVLGSLAPTLRTINPFQTRCNYLGLWTRNVPSTLSEGDASGNWFRFVPVLQLSEMLPRSSPAPAMHVNPLPVISDDECEVGNEPYLGGQSIGNVSGTQPNRTQDTSIPAGVATTP